MIPTPVGFYAFRGRDGRWRVYEASQSHRFMLLRDWLDEGKPRLGYFLDGEGEKLDAFVAEVERESAKSSP